MNSILSIPIEIINVIVSYFDNPFDILNLSQVCKKFRKLKSNVFYMLFLVTFDGDYHIVFDFIKLFKSLTNAKKFIINEKYTFSNKNNTFLEKKFYTCIGGRNDYINIDSQSCSSPVGYLLEPTICY